MQLTEGKQRILFKASIYDTQIKKTIKMGFKGITNGKFGEILLHRKHALDSGMGD